MQNLEIEPLLTPEEVSEIIKVDVQTLAKWRCERRAKRKRSTLRFLKPGGSVRYRQRDVQAWLEASERIPGEGKPRRKRNAA